MNSIRFQDQQFYTASIIYILVGLMHYNLSIYNFEHILIIVEKKNLESFLDLTFLRKGTMLLCFKF